MTPFAGVLADDRILPGDANDDYTHDEALGGVPQVPMAVLLPETTDEVAEILRVCNEQGIAVTGTPCSLARARMPATSLVFDGRTTAAGRCQVAVSASSCP